MPPYLFNNILLGGGGENSPLLSGSLVRAHNSLQHLTTVYEKVGDLFSAPGPYSHMSKLPRATCKWRMGAEAEVSGASGETLTFVEVRGFYIEPQP